MYRRKRACCAAVIAVFGCGEGSAPDVRQERDAEQQREPDADDGGTSDAEAADAGQRRPNGFDCRLTWGTITTSPAGSAEVLWWYSPSGPTRGVPPLLVVADRVEAITVTGERIHCSSASAHYGCHAEHEFHRLVVTLGEQQWTEQNRCHFLEDPQQISIDTGGCVAEGSVALEGSLLDYDPERAVPEVTLEGPRQDVRGSTGLGELADRIYILGTRCRVADGRYTCPALGFPHTETHTLVVGGTRTSVELPVADCTVEPVQLDVQCPTVPHGFYVKQPPGTTRLRVTASYEGGEPRECSEAKGPTTGRADRFFPSRGREYICPPAPGQERGRGSYRVSAEELVGPLQTARLYEAEASDVFDACAGSRVVVELRLKE